MVVTDEVARTTLSQMYEDAAASIDAREQVLKIVSHDLRNPLHTISMCASLLLDLPLPPDQQAEHLQRIKRSGDRMNRLVQDLLDIAKLEAGRVAIATRQVEVGPMVREAYGMLVQHRVGERGAPGDGCRGRTAAGRRRRGARHPGVVEPGGQRREVHARGARSRSAPRTRRAACASPCRTPVSGMTPEQLSKLFGQFWQAQSGGPARDRSRALDRQGDRRGPRRADLGGEPARRGDDVSLHVVGEFGEWTGECSAREADAADDGIRMSHQGMRRRGRNVDPPSFVSDTHLQHRWRHSGRSSTRRSRRSRTRQLSFWEAPSAG